MSNEDELIPKNYRRPSATFKTKEHLQEQWGEGAPIFTGFYFCEPFVEQVLEEIKDKGFNKILV